MRAAGVVFLGALIGASAAGAQTRRERPGLELRPFVGAYVPLGSMRDAVGEALVAGGQGAINVSPAMMLVGAFELARVDDRTLAADRRARLVQYDLGVELNRRVALSADWDLEPFAGGGLGIRSWSVTRDAERDHTQSQLAGYASAGLELQAGALALRSEARGYLSRFAGLLGDGPRKMRGDATFAVGLGWRFP